MILMLGTDGAFYGGFDPCLVKFGDNVIQFFNTLIEAYPAEEIP